MLLGRLPYELLHQDLVGCVVWWYHCYQQLLWLLIANNEIVNDNERMLIALMSPTNFFFNNLDTALYGL